MTGRSGFTGRLLISSGTGQPLRDIAHQATKVTDVAPRSPCINPAQPVHHVTQRKAARFGRRIRMAAGYALLPPGADVFKRLGGVQ